MNVLVDDGHHCIISDFGLREVKSEANRKRRFPRTFISFRFD